MGVLKKQLEKDAEEKTNGGKSQAKMLGKKDRGSQDSEHGVSALAAETAHGDGLPEQPRAKGQTGEERVSSLAVFSCLGKKTDWQESKGAKFLVTGGLKTPPVLDR